jgi:hypothetical protein
VKLIRFFRIRRNPKIE